MPEIKRSKTGSADKMGKRNDDQSRSLSPLSPNYMRRGEWGNRNFTLSTVWDSEVSEALGSADMVLDVIPMSRRNFQDLFYATMRNMSYSFCPIQKNNFVVIVREIKSPSCCANKILLSTRSFTYSWVSNRIEINVQFLPYQEETLVQESGNRSPSTPPHRAKLVAFGELAQLLALKVELNDLLITSGYDLSIRIGQPKIYLNGNTVDNNNNGNVQDSALDIIHYPFQWDEENAVITMMEQIKPHPQKLDYFRFTYNSCLAHEGRDVFRKQVILDRHFSLSDYVEARKDQHHGRPEPFGIPISSNSYEALEVYEDMTCSTLGVLDYENKKIEKRETEKLSEFIARAKIMGCLAMIPVMALICYVNPLHVNSFMSYFGLSEE